MALPEYFKIHVHNATGAAIEFTTDSANNTLTIKGLPWNRDSNGALAYGSEVSLYDDSGDLADDAMDSGSEIDNSSNKYEGMFCRAALTTDASTSGDIMIYISWTTSGGAGGTYPEGSDDTDKDTIEADLVLVGKLSTDSTDDDRGCNFEI